MRTYNLRSMKYIVNNEMIIFFTNLPQKEDYCKNDD